MLFSSATDDARTGPIGTPFGFGQDAELIALRKRAVGGDRTALAALEARPTEERGVTDWQALARGYAVSGNLGASVDAYEKLLVEKPDFASRPETLRDLRQAAKSPATGQRALRLFVSLGNSGADLLFDAHEDLGRTSPELAAEAKRLLAREDVRANASPALLVALELREAKGCQAYKELLPRAAEHADRRSVPILERLNKRSGCGFFRRRDCYACLRRGDELGVALANAEKRTAQSYAR
jgi:hypothetical protein